MVAELWGLKHASISSSNEVIVFVEDPVTFAYLLFRPWLWVCRVCALLSEFLYCIGCFQLEVLRVKNIVDWRSGDPCPGSHRQHFDDYLSRVDTFIFLFLPRPGRGGPRSGGPRNVWQTITDSINDSKFVLFTIFKNLILLLIVHWTAI